MDSAIRQFQAFERVDDPQDALVFDDWLVDDPFAPVGHIPAGVTPVDEPAAESNFPALLSTPLPTDGKADAATALVAGADAGNAWAALCGPHLGLAERDFGANAAPLVPFVDFFPGAADTTTSSAPNTTPGTASAPAPPVGTTPGLPSGTLRGTGGGGTHEDQLDGLDALIAMCSLHLPAWASPSPSPLSSLSVSPALVGLSPANTPPYLSLNAPPSSSSSTSPSPPPPPPRPASSLFIGTSLPGSSRGRGTHRDADSPHDQTRTQQLAAKRAKRRPAPYAVPCPPHFSDPPSTSTSPSPSPEPASPSSPAPAAAFTSALKVSPRRNAQVIDADTSAHPASGTSLPSPSSRSASGSASSDSPPPSCPHCGWTGSGTRGTRGASYTATLRRHVATHTAGVGRNVLKWVCTGLPLLASDDLPILPGPTQRMMWYEGVLMRGGCGRTFSRRDALKRHVDRSGGRCVTAHDGPWLVGNRGKGDVM